MTAQAAARNLRKMPCTSLGGVDHHVVLAGNAMSAAVSAATTPGACLTIRRTCTVTAALGSPSKIDAPHDATGRGRAAHRNMQRSRGFAQIVHISRAAGHVADSGIVGRGYADDTQRGRSAI